MGDQAIAAGKEAGIPAGGLTCSGGGNVDAMRCDGAIPGRAAFPGDNGRLRPDRSDPRQDADKRGELVGAAERGHATSLKPGAAQAVACTQLPVR
jgi:hypothetical protein